MTEHNGLYTALRANCLKALSLILGCALILFGWVSLSIPGPQFAWAEDGQELLPIRPGQDYSGWKQAFGWKDLLPFSDSTSRFRIEDNALVLSSQGESFLIGREFGDAERQGLLEHPFMRFVVRVETVPEGARLMGETRDDAAFRLYVLYNDAPMEALAYVWSWDLPVGQWSSRADGWFGDYSGVHRKSFGTGEPPGQWWTVEVDLRRDFQSRFPGRPLQVPLGLGLKTDSNDTPNTRSRTRLRSIQFYRTSLRNQGLADGAPWKSVV